MPRGIKKQINYAEEIEKIQTRITYHQKFVNELELEKEALIAKKNEHDINSLYAFLSQNNLNAEQLLMQLNLQSA